jgi:hypothetical protein
MACLISKLSVQDLVITSERNVESACWVGGASGPVEIQRLRLNITRDKLSISNKLKIEKGRRTFWRVFYTLVDQVCKVHEERGGVTIAELLPRAGFAFPRTSRKLDALLQATGHQVAIKNIHPTNRSVYYNDPLYQYLFDIPNTAVVEYFIGQFGEAEQLRFFGIDSAKKLSKLVKSLTECFRKTDTQGGEDIFKLVECVMFFCFDGCHLFIEGKNEARIRNIQHLIQGASTAGIDSFQ